MISEKDLKLFFNKMDSIKYLVMRNYVGLLEDINTGGDIDLLIENVEEFIKCAEALPLNNREKCYNYKVLIGDAWVPVDIREVGDDYYDKAWETKMLEQRVLYQDTFYVMNEEDFFHSIVYHSILHKPEVPKKYCPMFEERLLFTKKDLFRALNRFMKENGYDYVTPVDKGVKFNIKNTRKLKLLRFFSR